MKSKILVSLGLVVLIMAMALPAFAATPDSARLIADGRGEALDVGGITVEVIEDNLIVTYTIDELNTEWRLEETHLYVGDEAPAKSAPGKFPCKSEELGMAVTESYTIPVADIDLDGDGIVYVAAHAALSMQDGVDEETGEPIYISESAWAQVGEGDLGIGKAKNWATCFMVTLY